MFFLIVSLICFILSGLSFWRYIVLNQRKKLNEWDIGAVMLSALGTVFVITSIIFSMIEISSQLDNIEELQRYSDNEKIYRTKCEDLTKQFAIYLSDKYPKHEKDIFKSISPDKIYIYLVKYPEIKSNQTIMKLVEYISYYQEEIYAQKIARVKMHKQMRYRKINPWIFNYLIPDIPENTDIL